VRSSSLDERADHKEPPVKILNVVAHEDDDLLFMSPPLLQSIGRGDSITTLYLTAGDDGLDAAYWQGREQGAKAAYASMLGGGEVSWTDGTVSSVSGAAALPSAIAQRGGVDLIFVRLPDGNVDGSGFASTGNQSLQKLLAGDITAMTTVDGARSYSSAELRETIAGVVTQTAPDLVMLQDFIHANAGPPWSDHADHLAGSVFAFWAAAQAGVHTVVTAWEGYQAGSSQAANISNASLLAAKQATFAAYYAHDDQVVPTAPDWATTYGAWLERACPTGQYIF
jgi:LmbE family N-acetylglucosaminyl deacetylase